MALQFLCLKPPTGSKSKNIVRDFVYGCWCNGKRIGGMQMPPMNDLYVTTHVRQEGVQATLLDAVTEPEEYDRLVAGGIKAYSVVAILCSTQSFRADVNALRELKAIHPELKGILFGSHPTFMPNYCLQADGVDFIVLREPEETMRALVGALARGEEPREIEGIGYRDAAGEIVVNPPRPFMDMDDLPIPDRTLLPAGVDYFNPVVKRVPYTTMQTTRGCPARCTFCTVPFFYGTEFREQSVERVLEEFRAIRDLGYKEVFIRDETFTAATDRNKEICRRMIEEKLDLTWIANSRVNTVDKEMMQLLKRAGCHLLKFGVETASDDILRAYKKGALRQHAIDAFRMTREVGLNTHAHIIFGGPGETPQTAQETIDFVIELGATTASFGIVTPYPGTPMFRDVAEKHPEIKDGTDSNLENLHVTGFYSETISGMSGEELSQWIVKAYRSFYWRPAYLIKRLVGIRSFDEFMTLFVAGLNIFQFSMKGEK